MMLGFAPAPVPGSMEVEPPLAVKLPAVPTLPPNPVLPPNPKPPPLPLFSQGSLMMGTPSKPVSVFSRLGKNNSFSAVEVGKQVLPTLRAPQSVDANSVTCGKSAEKGANTPRPRFCPLDSLWQPMH